MINHKLTQEEVDLLNSKIGLHTALKSKTFNLKKVLDEAKYIVELKQQQEELIKLQNWIGEIVFFDRSWYNRAVVEPVNNFCSEKEYSIFMSQVNDFEKMLVQSDTYLIKLYFSITKSEQAKRFKEIKNSPLKRWKMTPLDEKAQALWNDYSIYKKQMFEATNTDHAPWNIIDANQKSNARMNAIKLILNSIPYK